MTLEELYRVLRSSHVQAQGIVDTLREPLVVLDRNCCVQNANPGFFKTFQAERDDVLGKNLFELGNGQWDIKELRELLGEVVPKARAIIGFQVTHDFPTIGERTMLLTARRLQHPDENSAQMLLVFEDVTDRHEADAAKDILLAETRHRMKNLMAVVHAVASQTETEGLTAEQYRETLMGRLDAVTNAQLLISAPGEEVDLSVLIDQTLRPVAGRGAKVTGGPAVTLVEHQILPVSMMLHELATNSLKYGALSDPRGVVHAGWTTEDRDGEQYFQLSWREEGGPAVSPPIRQGFGMKLLKHSVKAEGGDIEMDFASAGLNARISFPLAPSAAA